MINQGQTESDGWERAEQILSKYSAHLRDGPDPGIPQPFNSYWNQYPTHRPLEEIAKTHGYNPEEFEGLIKGKTVLDIGGGYSSLAHDAEFAGFGASIFNLDLPGVFFEGKKNEKARLNASYNVAGLGHELPFRDESIDTVLATYSLPFYLHNTDHAEGYWNELLRVIKPAGTISVAPMQTTGFRGEAYYEHGVLRVWGMVRSMSSMPELSVKLVKDRRVSALRITKISSFAMNKAAE